TTSGRCCDASRPRLDGVRDGDLRLGCIHLSRRARLAQPAQEQEGERPLNKKNELRTSGAERPRILPQLWLQGLQGLISNALGFKRRVNHKGVVSSGYFEGIHTTHQMKLLQKRRAKNKVAR